MSSLSLEPAEGKAMFSSQEEGLSGLALRHGPHSPTSHHPPQLKDR